MEPKIKILMQSQSSSRGLVGVLKCKGCGCALPNQYGVCESRLNDCRIPSRNDYEWANLKGF